MRLRLTTAGPAAARPWKLLFAGGCHLTGYPVGEEFAFPLDVARRLKREGVDIEMRSIHHVPLHHAATVVQACHEFRPDALVFQLCHYELNVSLRERLHSLLTGGRRPQKTGAATWQMGRPPRRRREYYVARGVLKAGGDALLGRRAVDLAALERRLEAFLTNIDACEIETVVFLSPFPCLDEMTRYYRRRAAPMIQAVATRHRCSYVDVSALRPELPERFVGVEEFFADGLHLGIRGQAAVGRVVTENLLKCAPAGVWKTAATLDGAQSVLRGSGR